MTDPTLEHIKNQIIKTAVLVAQECCIRAVLQDQTNSTVDLCANLDKDQFNALHQWSEQLCEDSESDENEDSHNK